MAAVLQRIRVTDKEKVFRLIINFPLCIKIIYKIVNFITTYK